MSWRPEAAHATLRREMAETLAEFIGEVARLQGGARAPGWDAPELWFRGHRDGAWHLEPTLLREPLPPATTRGSYEENLTVQFAARAPGIDGREYKNDLLVRVTMQHYGVPTRLLDWTTSSLAALYFAVRETRRAEDAKVYVLNANGLAWLSSNAASSPASSQIEVLNRNDPATQHLRLRGYSLPTPLVPVYDNSRVVAQRGVFTYHPRDNGDAIDGDASRAWAADTKCSGWLVESIPIPGVRKERLLRELALCGSTGGLPLPGLGRTWARIADAAHRQFGEPVLRTPTWRRFDLR